jgi:hypothetical protein
MQLQQGFIVSMGRKTDQLGTYMPLVRLEIRPLPSPRVPRPLPAVEKVRRAAWPCQAARGNMVMQRMNVEL